MATERRVSVDPTFTTWQLGVGKNVTLLGLMIVTVAVIVGIVVATLVSGYYTDPKSIRDAAAAGDQVLSDQGTIAAAQIRGSCDDIDGHRRIALGNHRHVARASCRAFRGRAPADQEELVASV